MNKLSFFLSLVLVLLFSCNSDDSDESGTSENNITLITNEVQDIQGTTVVLSGTVTSNTPSFSLRGVCWSTSENPTINSGDYEFDNNNANGTFSFTVNSLNANTQYYVRAVVQINANGEYIYGNQIVFTTPNPLTTNLVSDITTTKAILNGNITQGTNEYSLVGFFYSDQPNVTQNDSEVIADYNLVGSDDFSIEVNNLNYNTVYYVRSFSYDGSYYTLGNEQQFKTVGYYGPAGGYVAYDKGEYNNGWRYFEISPTTLSYDITYTTGSAWGSAGQFITGTLPDIGKGLENTLIIVNNESNQNCAAKLCNNLTLNGYSDWFLPSSEEMLLISNSLYKAGINNIGDYCWTSTQNGADYAYSTVFENSSVGYEIFEYYPKGFNNLKVFPVRRY